MKQHSTSRRRYKKMILHFISGAKVKQYYNSYLHLKTAEHRKPIILSSLVISIAYKLMPSPRFTLNTKITLQFL